MTQPDHEDRAPGMGDPTRSDDVAIPGLRTGGPGSAGTAADDRLTSPAPAGDEPGASGPGPEGPSAGEADPDPGSSGPQGGQLGTAGGGYGSASGEGTSGVGPDGEDVQARSGPGPQTDWLRSEGGGSDPVTRGPDA